MMDGEPAIGKIDNTNKDNKANPVRKFMDSLRKITMAGFVLSASFLPVKKVLGQTMQKDFAMQGSSAKQAPRNTSKENIQGSKIPEGAVTRDSVLYKMTKIENGEIFELTREVDRLIHTLQKKFKEANLPITELGIPENEKEEQSFYDVFYQYENVKVGIPGGWRVDLSKPPVRQYPFADGDTLNVRDTTLIDDWVSINNESKIFSFGMKGNSVILEYYTKDSGLVGMTSFEYGETIKEEGGVMIEHYVEENSKNEGGDNKLKYDKGVAGDGGEKLKNALLEIINNLTLVANKHIEKISSDEQ